MKTKIILLLVLIVNQSYGQFFAPMTAPPADFKQKPTLLWKYKTNGPIVGSPVIENGTVYIGSLDSTLYALDLLSGKEKWKLPTGGAIRSSVCMAGQRLFVLNCNSMLFMVEKDSGRIDGFFQAMNGYIGDRQHDFADYYTSTPILVDSTIYFGSGEDIYAISISDGFVKWVFKTNDVVHTRPAIYKNKLYAGSFDGNLYAIDINTGSLAWKFKTTGRYSFPKGEVMGNPVIAGGTVIFGARDYNLYAVDTRGGFCSWMKQFPYGWALPVTVNDSVVYVGTSDDRTMYAFNIQTGQEVWKTPAGFNVLGGCAIGKQVGYFCTLAGKVNGMDLTTGKILWSIELDSYKANHLKWLKPDDSYLDNIGKLIKNLNEILNMYKDLGGIFGTPALGEDQLVVAGYDGWVYCFSDSAK